MNERRADGSRPGAGAGRSGNDNRKQAVSIRMSRGDVRLVKQLADRLGVRDSDVIRYAIKHMLSRLAPLPDATVRGHALLPVFVEAGAELMRHFDLDATRLAEIINDGADASRKVDAGDIQLIAMSGTQAPYAKVRFAVIGREQAIERAHLLRTNAKEPIQEVGHAASPVRGQNDGRALDDGYAGGELSADSARQSLRRYLYEKYLYAQAADSVGGAVNGAG
ncbi:MAG TPA: hypothetical protein VMT83_11345 [Burkholderiaceae bacterium]|nr:hypothetical protein [Burkholderiaceae bacterium]